jgi:hypothetical protein
MSDISPEIVNATLMEQARVELNDWALLQFGFTATYHMSENQSNIQ